MSDSAAPETLFAVVRHSLVPLRDHEAIDALKEIETLLNDVRTYLDRPFVIWPHHELCDVQRKDLVARLSRVGES